ncbi:hypothetical protein ACFLQO_01065 [Candidatus Aenigmatarchaeota archaeon]
MVHDPEIELGKIKRGSRKNTIIFAVIILAANFIAYYFHMDLIKLAMYLGLSIFLIVTTHISFSKAKIKNGKINLMPYSFKSLFTFYCFLGATFFYFVSILGIALGSTAPFALLSFFLIGVIFTIAGMFLLKRR